MTIPADEAALIPLTTDAALQERVTDLLQCAFRRQWWTLYLDADDRQLPVIMPMAGYPHDPTEPVIDGSGFPGTAAQLLADRLAMMIEDLGAASVVFVWERPGSAESTPADRAWARELADACRAETVRVRAQFIAHSRGIRWFAPDDFA
ncbi:hypothetical protein [Agromyces larvae]|uniref:Uncharacterized protein n=1 Tax=Agromyces larvae TaxID=2929802 RepID=A0ABY4C2R8_9MICO|nr:hypothetical protein [Agromyces larvae]UOE45773.1 hypothetical protein MTO99_08525 [Agromyces larvae]